MGLSLIYARSTNWCIGKNGKVPWHLPDEFAHFKRVTMGKPIIMGRKSYEDHKSLLPGRLNIVISRKPDYKAVDGILLVQSLEHAMETAYADNDEIFVIGGAGLLAETLPVADAVYETLVDTDIEGDAYLPRFDFSDWTSEILERHSVDERHPLSYTAYCHRRKTGRTSS